MPKVKEGEATNGIFAFPTIEPNELVAMYHSKAMAVTLRTQDEIETWMDAPTPVALQLQRPLNYLGTMAYDATHNLGARRGKSDNADLTP